MISSEREKVLLSYLERIAYSLEKIEKKIGIR